MYSVVEVFDNYSEILTFINGAGIFYDRLGKYFQYSVFITDKFTYKVEIRVYVKRNL